MVGAIMVIGAAAAAPMISGLGRGNPVRAQPLNLLHSGITQTAPTGFRVDRTAERTERFEPSTYEGRMIALGRSIGDDITAFERETYELGHKFGTSIAMGFGAIRTRDDLAEHRAKCELMLEREDEWAELFEDAWRRAEPIIARAGFKKDREREALDDVREYLEEMGTFDETVPLDAVLHARLDQLEVLERSWGTWHAQPLSGGVAFENEQDMDAFNEASERLRRAWVKMNEAMIRARP